MLGSAVTYVEGGCARKLEVECGGGNTARSGEDLGEVDLGGCRCCCGSGCGRRHEAQVEGAVGGRDWRRGPWLKFSGDGRAGGRDKPLQACKCAVEGAADVSR